MDQLTFYVIFSQMRQAKCGDDAVYICWMPSPGAISCLPAELVISYHSYYRIGWFFRKPFLGRHHSTAEDEELHIHEGTYTSSQRWIWVPSNQLCKAEGCHSFCKEPLEKSVTLVELALEYQRNWRLIFHGNFLNEKKNFIKSFSHCQNGWLEVPFPSNEET